MRSHPPGQPKRARRGGRGNLPRKRPRQQKEEGGTVRDQVVLKGGPSGVKKKLKTENKERMLKKNQWKGTNGDRFRKKSGEIGKR